MITEKSHTLVADVMTDGESVRLEVEVPGLEWARVEVHATGHTVTVRVRRQSTPQGRYLLAERGTDDRRSFDLPAKTDMRNLHARVRDGVLTITAPFGDGRPAPTGTRVEVQPSVFACHPDAAPV